jgi:uncharacterized protein (DUF1800 family)
MRAGGPVMAATTARDAMARPFPALRHIAALLALAGACAAMTAHAAAMGPDDARHLLARTGFGPSATDIQRFAALDRAQAVEALLADARTQPLLPPPVFTDTAVAPGPGRTLTPEERRAFVREQNEHTQALRGWWIAEMVATPSPLTERMTLFWHNHFVSSQQKVRLARLMYAQNATFRANALGSFATLLHAVARDPAMVIYLDSAQNRKGAPNENFAREVMELFTLGEGHYTEQDVKEAARAFTGWTYDRAAGTFVERPRLHDDGEKVIFGHRGNFDGDDVLDLILARPETARFVVGKLWREFVSSEPDAASIARIADRFRYAHYDVKVALRDLLLEPAFWAPANRGTLVKSPVEVVVGTLRALDVRPDAGLPFALAAAGMSQVLFAPPNVKGWPGGDSWINSSTLLARKQFLDALARTSGRPAPESESMASLQMTAAVPQAAADEASMSDEAQRRLRAARSVERALARLRFAPQAWLDAKPGDDAATRFAAAQRVLLPLAPVTTDVAEARAQRDPALFVRAALLDPVYQLK